MMADDALHVCSELLTVSVSPIPSIHENQYLPSRALAPDPTTVAFVAIRAILATPLSSFELTRESPRFIKVVQVRVANKYL
jgi:hypothetical protein